MGLVDWIPGYDGDSDDGSTSDDGSIDSGGMVGSIPEDTDDGGGTFNLTEKKILEALGIGAGTWATLTAFATDPLGFMLERLLPWVVGGILDGWMMVLGAFGSAWEPVTTIPTTLSSPLVSAGGAILSPILRLIETLNDAIVGLAQAAGPFAPLVVAGIWIGIGAIAGAVLSSIPYLRGVRAIMAVVSS